MKGLSFCLPYNFANFLSYQYCILELLKQKQKNEEYPTQFAEISKERNDATFLFTSLNSFYNKIIALSINIIVHLLVELTTSLTPWVSMINIVQNN